jgi:1-pyrroline-5-carboxylate dehydrogenase
MKNLLTRPQNEPIHSYLLGSSERQSLQSTLQEMASQIVDIPCIINGKEIRTGNKQNQVMPHDHQHILAHYHLAGEKELELAIQASLQAKAEWEALSWMDRSMIFLKAADLIAGPWRDRLNAATMLGQSKNIFQSEIDAACELTDSLRFNAYFYQEILKDQPHSSPQILNQVDYRPLEGFVAAITPFNFTAIAGNLCSAPAMMGNTVVWKPSDTQVLSAYLIMKIFEEAGLPPGVINFVPANGPLAGKILLNHPALAGIHFTGSTQTFKSLYTQVGQNISLYKSYPRLVGETGGKDFIFAHEDCHEEALITAMIRGAFEYQGQKCSAASRAYIPRHVWKRIKPKLIEQIATITLGDVREFEHFMNAVIDERAFKKIMSMIAQAKDYPHNQLLSGGTGNATQGYFIKPTLFETHDPHSLTMTDEIFGPVLTVYPYDEKHFEETLTLCDQTSPYALTGAIFARDRNILVHMSQKLRNAAGNLYINDKPTGAVVGQQPFGGARASGTNDKAGSALNLLRWTSPRTLKENFVSPTEYRYPYMFR